MSSSILCDIDEKRRIATITFNRPEKLNAMEPGDGKQFHELLETLQADDRVKVIVIKGSGRAFCTGIDAGMMAGSIGFNTQKGSDGRYKRTPQHRRLRFDDKEGFGPRGGNQTLLGCNKATIAQVHGYAYGGGFFIAMYCDITIAAEGTMFTHAGYRLVGPSAGGLPIPLIINCGLKKANELMLTGRPFEAKEAERLGIVNKVVPPDKLEDEVHRYADTIALLSLEGIVTGKYAIMCALDKLGYFGYMPVVVHNLGENVVWEEGDFNWFKEVRNRGTKEAIKERERRYAALGMDLESAKRDAGII
jgi:enoyl-CoA hydratase